MKLQCGRYFNGHINVEAESCGHSCLYSCFVHRLISLIHLRMQRYTPCPLASRFESTLSNPLVFNSQIVYQLTSSVPHQTDSSVRKREHFQISISDSNANGRPVSAHRYQGHQSLSLGCLNQAKTNSAKVMCSPTSNRSLLTSAPAPSYDTVL